MIKILLTFTTLLFLSQGNTQEPLNTKESFSGLVEVFTQVMSDDIDSFDLGDLNQIRPCSILALKSEEGIYRYEVLNYVESPNGGTLNVRKTKINSYGSSMSSIGIDVASDRSSSLSIGIGKSKRELAPQNTSSTISQSNRTFTINFIIN